MLFFDLEAYAPPDERTASRGSLIVNPARPGHVLLGGGFFSRRFADPFPQGPQVQGLWLWDFGSRGAGVVFVVVGGGGGAPARHPRALRGGVGAPARGERARAGQARGGPRRVRRGHCPVRPAGALLPLAPA